MRIKFKKDQVQEKLSTYFQSVSLNHLGEFNKTKLSDDIEFDSDEIFFCEMVHDQKTNFQQVHHGINDCPINDYYESLSSPRVPEVPEAKKMVRYNGSLQSDTQSHAIKMSSRMQQKLLNKMFYYRSSMTRQEAEKVVYLFKKLQIS